MTRTVTLLAVLLATLLLVPAAVANKGDDGGGHHAKRVGTVVSVDAAAGTVTIKIDGATLLTAGDTVVVKAREFRRAEVVVPRDEEDEQEDDEDEQEVEVKGQLTSLLPLTVTTKAGRAVTCVIPAGVSLTGFTTGMRVQMKCDDVNGTLTLRRLRAEKNDRQNGDHSGPGRGDDDHQGQGNPGGGGKDDD